MIKFKIQSLNEDYKFRLYGNVVINSGVFQDVLVDLIESRILIIPKLISSYIMNRTDSIDQNLMVKSLNRLVDLGFGFYTTVPSQFPEIEKEFISYSIIENAVV